MIDPVVNMPLWFVVLHPITWLVTIPLEFIQNTVILILFFNVININYKKAAYRQCILPLCLFTMIAHLNCAAILFFIMYFNMYNFVITIFGVFFSALLVYYLNLKITFRDIEATVSDIKRLSFAVAVFTAPYVFLLPADLII